MAEIGNIVSVMARCRGENFYRTLVMRTPEDHKAERSGLGASTAGQASR